MRKLIIAAIVVAACQYIYTSAGADAVSTITATSAERIAQIEAATR